MKIEETSLVEEQEMPEPNDKPAVWELVIKDMMDRDQVGRARYGTPLQPFNGRKPLIDMYQELFDATVYCRQEIEERRLVRLAVLREVRVMIVQLGFVTGPLPALIQDLISEASGK